MTSYKIKWKVKPWIHPPFPTHTKIVWILPRPVPQPSTMLYMVIHAVAFA